MCPTSKDFWKSRYGELFEHVFGRVFHKVHVSPLGNLSFDLVSLHTYGGSKSVTASVTHYNILK